MNPAPLYILSLEEDRLAWLSLSEERRQKKISGTGVISGVPGDTLDQWLTTVGEKSSNPEIYLYDARPIYFALSVDIPKRASKQADGIIKMKIRQELGLGEETVCWSAASRAGVSTYNVTVARKDAFDDLARWKDRHGLKRLWVGSDFAAIRQLHENGFVSTPAVLTSEIGEGCRLYAIAADGSIRKARSESAQGDASSQEFSDASAWVHAGSRGSSHAQLSWPGLASCRAGKWADPQGEKSVANFWMVHKDELRALDPVLLGGLCDVGLRRATAASLIGPVERPAPLDELLNRWSVPKLAFAAGLSLVLLFSLTTVVHLQKSSAYEKLSQRADSVEAGIRRLEAQEAVLKKIESDRTLNIPVIELVHQSAPAETTLQTLNISETGALEISATAKNDQSATAFFKALSTSNKFDKVNLQNLRMDEGKKWTSFQISGQIKGRKKR